MMMMTTMMIRGPESRLLCMTIVVLSQLVHSCNSGRRCGHTLEYGEDCSFLPAPPGRTPACAAPGYTYCEQLDHYPNDLIRHLVDKGEYDFSTLLSDETRDNFGATKPSQGPYAYGPHSLSGIQGISLVTEKPTIQGHGQDQHHGQDQYHFNTPNTYQGGGYTGQYFPPQTKGNPQTPNGGYNGAFSPQQRPQPYLPPPRDSYLPPPKASNASKSGVDLFQTSFPINLDQYDDFWRGNSYFEVPKRPPPPSSFADTNFQRTNFGPNLEYFDSNGPSPYYSASGGGGGGTHFPKAPAGGQAGWPSSSSPAASSAASSTAADADKHRQRQGYPFRDFVPPPVTSYDPSDWWKRHSNNNNNNNNNNYRRSSSSDVHAYKSLDSNELKGLGVSKRDTRKSVATATSSAIKNVRNPFLAADAIAAREKRQAQQTGTGEQLCPTRSQYITPRAALNKEGNWMYVVNMEGNNDNQYSQLVKSEVCVSQQCDGICSLPLGYTSRCEQRYVQKRLVALDQGGQRLYTDIFWFPSCCLCTITNNNQT